MNGLARRGSASGSQVITRHHCRRLIPSWPLARPAHGRFQYSWLVGHAGNMREIRGSAVTLLSPAIVCRDSGPAGQRARLHGSENLAGLLEKFPMSVTAYPFSRNYSVRLLSASPLLTSFRPSMAIRPDRIVPFPQARET